MSNNRFVAMSLALLLVGVAIGYGLSITVPYQVRSQEPKISLNKTTVTVGEEYTATLSGFPVNTEIFGISVNNDPPQIFSAGTTNLNGQLTLTSNAPPTSGTWPLIACDKNQNILATATLFVTQ